MTKHPAEVLASARSLHKDFATRVEFVNTGTTAAAFYWLDYDGKRVFCRSLPPGETYLAETYLTHPWLITDLKGTVALLFYPDGQPRRVEILLPEARAAEGSADQPPHKEIRALLLSLVKQLKVKNALTDPRVEAALQAMPRHLFLPDHPLDRAFEDVALMTKQKGEAQSACSQPAIVVIMLEQLGLQPGDRVLEIGAGTGWNAALMAHLVGPQGRVMTLDIDQDTAQRAKENLAGVKAENVEVLCADGGFGAPAHAPYDAVIVTAAVEDISPHWFEQLREGGRLVAPMMFNMCGFSAAFHKERTAGLADPVLVSHDFQYCGFMPLRGQFAGSRTSVQEPNLQLNFDAASGMDAAALQELLRAPSREALIPALQGEDNFGFIEYLAFRGEPLIQIALPREYGASSLYGLVHPHTSLTAVITRWEEARQLPKASIAVRTYGDDSSLSHLQQRAKEWEAHGRPGLARMRVVAAPLGILPGRLGDVVVRKRWMEYQTTFG